MRVPRAFAFALIVVTCGPSIAQDVVIDTIAMQQPLHQQELYTFPRITMPHAPHVARNIQRNLCVDLLEVDPDTAEGHWFDLVWGDTSGWMPRLNSIDWNVTQPLPKVLSVEFSAEGCGAYCEGFTVYRNYDLRSGAYFDYDTLFTLEGRVTVNDTLQHLWVPLVEDHLQAMKDSLNAPRLSPELYEYFQEAVDLYVACLERRDMEGPYIDDIQPTPTSMLFYISRCSGHVNRNVDELDPVIFELPYTWLVPKMRSEYRSLFQ